MYTFHVSCLIVFDIYLFTIYHYKSFSLCNGSCDISSSILGFYEFGSFFVLVSQLVLFTDEDIFFESYRLLASCIYISEFLGSFVSVYPSSLYSVLMRLSLMNK